MKEPKHLSQSLEHQLKTYVVAASAAGVGMLALAQPAEGKIVYTRADVKIRGTYDLDIDHNGTSDFQFGNQSASNTTNGGVDFLTIHGTQGKRGITGVRNSNSRCRCGSAYDLRAGVNIQHATLAEAWMAGVEYYKGQKKFSGKWANAGKGVQDRYLGLKFFVNGKAHYGWARLNVEFRDGIEATLTGYAYETIANKPIITGKARGPDVVTVQPASLGHLAAGASAVPAWRVKQTAASAH